MTALRLFMVALLAVLAGLPLGALLLELDRLPSGWSVWQEWERLLSLAGNSLRLVGGATALAMPPGLLVALLLFRTDVPGRRAWLAFTFGSLFVPLPLTTSAWQFVHAWLRGGSDAAWTTGWIPAIAIHAIVALPWIIVIAGMGLRGVETELEEDARLGSSWPGVLMKVTLRRAWPAVALAILFAGLLAWNEIIVTDRMVIRTFSEEVYVAFVGGGGDELARAVALALPGVTLVAIGTAILVASWRRRWLPFAFWHRPPGIIRLGRWRWPLGLAVFLAAVLLIGVPLAALFHKAGLRYATAAHPGPPTWSAVLLTERLGRALTQQAWMLSQSVLMALLTGMATAGIAFILAWPCRGARWFERMTWILVATLWAIPGPVLGIGLLDAIQRLLDVPGGAVFGLFLYQRPSPLPNVWVCTLRFLPLAFAVLWPFARLAPAELDEIATLEGMKTWGRLRHVAWPLLRGPFFWAAGGVSVLALGEISASKLVTTPGFDVFAHHVFQQMHASADTDLAALCLVLLGVIGMGVMALLVRLNRST